METIHKNGHIRTQISNDERRAISQIIGCLGPLVKLEPIGRYAAMTAEEVWLTLVIQLCVMGSARHIERLTGAELKVSGTFSE